MIESKYLARHVYVESKQVKPGFTNYQPRGLENLIKFEV